MLLTYCDVDNITQDINKKPPYIPSISITTDVLLLPMNSTTTYRYAVLAQLEIEIPFLSSQNSLDFDQIP